MTLSPSEMTDQPTPRTEAWREFERRHEAVSQMPSLDAYQTLVDDMLDHYAAIEAQARTEALDVDALTRALHHVYCAYSDHTSETPEQAHRVEAATIAAILAAKADR